ncbi:MAG: alternative ribosome rescue aminoacyl-tRNA hydrolase ArfB [Bacteroidales bacterium]|nr:alternative ribosome rescue aminoacyl-tRNA hydrolase ArfB [Bacteroidales bacterium]MDD3861105.1 alternative ribosome rescue aminoacyl-tRNA hydrolase ArfB [Bacteroidales bacterium]
MDEEIIISGTIDHEIQLLFLRSSGPGGQNVNKVNSKVELRFDVENSTVLDDNQKSIIVRKLKSRISDLGILVLTCQTSRSQLKNKESVIKKFYKMINRALIPPKKRIKTKPSPASKEKRLKEKREISEKKLRRKTF